MASAPPRRPLSTSLPQKTLPLSLCFPPHPPYLAIRVFSHLFFLSLPGHAVFCDLKDCMAGKYFVMSIDRCCPRSLPSIAGDVTEDQTAYDTLYHWHATGSGVVNTPNLRRLLKKIARLIF